MDPEELAHLRRGDLSVTEVCAEVGFTSLGSFSSKEPIDQPYGVRDAAVRDPSGNHLRLSQPLAG